ncbi:D-alanyl-D-alanine carboxypeptidase family protein [Altererythrobacter sp.]|uniref:D-alanyl-D-alanine carboxypeptidase family protein n=1 Tax=Altererythrobacter sp. TaxID=1872480 RepID=UPI003D051ED9
MAGGAHALRVPEGDAIAQDAPIALLVDMRSGQTLYSKQADRRFVPASITKVMTAYVAFEMIAAGELSEAQQFTFSEAAAEEWKHTGSTMFLEPGEKVSVSMLLRGIASVSANDASIALAEGAAGSVDAWIEKMNVTARKLGMVNSHFGTPNGWPDDGRTFTSANDLAKLARALISGHPDLYARYFGKDGLRHNGIAQANHDPITRAVKGADGIKTGFTNEAGYGFLGSAERDGTRLIMVVAGVDKPRVRRDVSRGLIEWGYDGFARRLMYGKGQQVASARVQDGTSDHVTLVPAAPIKLAVPDGENPAVVLKLRYEGPLKAPIAKGEEVAVLELTVAGMPTSQIPLVAGDDVARAGTFRRIWNGLTGWFS